MASAPVVITGLDRPASFSGSRLSSAQFVWLAFVVVQALDGVMSYVGVSLHGPGIEGNPLVAWYMSAFGPAVGCSVLSLARGHRWVAALTLVYVVFAVVPWVTLLSGLV